MMFQEILNREKLFLYTNYFSKGTFAIFKKLDGKCNANVGRGGESDNKTT